MQLWSFCLTFWNWNLAFPHLHRTPKNATHPPNDNTFIITVQSWWGLPHGAGRTATGAHRLPCVGSSSRLCPNRTGCWLPFFACEDVGLYQTPWLKKGSLPKKIFDKKISYIFEGVSCLLSYFISASQGDQDSNELNGLLGNIASENTCPSMCFDY